ncbi:hypothetical protein ACFPN1_11700 [Lysobacter yangpyeongensis]|uniref:Lipoprotein n=1 Tax=Lysobacter yangpyeongensis TaxID=346182 RepID=A0ABW0SPC2_9GAMM
MVRRFRVAALVAVGALCACATGGAVPGQEFAMTPGQRIALPDTSSLHYLGIANDSRCPPKVQCIRAGDADVQFDRAVAGQAGVSRLSLNTERMRSVTLDVWRLQLVDLDPGTKPRVVLRLDAVTGASTP